MFATTDRACSGYLVEIGGKNLWMDAGAGTWQNLLGHVQYEDLDAVLLTHRHPDHTTDLFQALHARFLGGPEPLEVIPLWAPQETLDHLSAFYAELGRAFDPQPIASAGTLDYEGATLSFVEMAHPAETLGVRIEHDDSVLAYSADSGEEADFTTLAGGAHVFLCEATLQDSDDRWEGHLQASQAAEIAAGVGVRDLVLTHLPPGRDLGLSIAEAQKDIGDASVQLAFDGLQLEVAP
jgi:ribonuclease BN (tRNA processing enzyme)